MTRKVRTEEERARDELELAGRKRQRAQRKYDAAREVFREVEEELRLALAVEEHAASHPALRSDEPEEFAAVPVDDARTTYGAVVTREEQERLCTHVSRSFGVCDACGHVEQDEPAAVTA